MSEKKKESNKESNNLFDIAVGVGSRVIDAADRTVEKAKKKL